MILVNFEDYRLSTGAATYDRLLFGPDHPNVARLFETISNDQFTWRRAAVVGPVQFPGTVSEADADTGRFDSQVIRLAAAGVDFSRFATNGDGRIENEDVGILFVNANYPGVNGAGQTRSFPDLSIDGLRIRGEVSVCDELGGLNLFAHELFHQMGFPEHIYGPGAALNWRASLFAGSPDRPDHRPIQLDPCHKMMAGWLQPRVFRIPDGVGSSFLEASSLSHPVSRAS